MERFQIKSFGHWLLLSLTLFAHPLLGESQDQRYPGVTDPFGDPKAYEFAEDEKEDKEFFHLGRYLMLGVDAGVGVFTGDLGTNTSPGPYFGARLVYFFDRSIAMEAAVHYSNHLQEIFVSASEVFQIDTNLIPITLGLRYYIDTKSAPRAIAIANPYLLLGGGGYIRDQLVVLQPSGNSAFESATSNAFGGYAGGGVEFKIYRHIYFGIDVRYHMIFFPDETDVRPIPNQRAGDFFTGVAGISYNF